MSQILRSSSSLAGAQLPFLLRLSLGGADVDQRLQRVLDDRLGQAAGRVVGAAGAPVGPAVTYTVPLRITTGRSNVSFRTAPRRAARA